MINECKIETKKDLTVNGVLNNHNLVHVQEDLSIQGGSQLILENDSKTICNDLNFIGTIEGPSIQGTAYLQYNSNSTLNWGASFSGDIVICSDVQLLESRPGIPDNIVYDCTEINGFIDVFPKLEWSHGMAGSELTGLTNGIYELTVTDINQNTYDYFVILSPVQCLDLYDVDTSTTETAETITDIIVSPNPINNKVSIQVETSNADLSISSARIFNALGQIVYEENNSTSLKSTTIEDIDVQLWKSGLYIVHVFMSDGTVIRDTLFKD